MQREEVGISHNNQEIHKMDTESPVKVAETSLSDPPSKQQMISGAASEGTQLTNKMINYHHNQQQLSKKGRISQQKKESLTNNPYYSNYGYLHEWLRKECMKGKLTRQAYANTICLMDMYYRNNTLVKEKFLPIALCLMIISSKALQRKVLYTATVAKLNNIDFEKFLQIELELLIYFKFRIGSYNFVRVMNSYLKRWDDEVSKMNGWDYLLLFRDSEDNYMLYELIYYLCDSYLKHKKSLTQNRVKEIIKYVFFEKCHSQVVPLVNSIIETIFAQRIYTQQQQYFYSFEKSDQIDPLEFHNLLTTSKRQFFLLDDLLRNNYRKNRTAHSTYNEFIYILP